MYTVYMYIYIAKTAYQANALRDIYIYIYTCHGHLITVIHGMFKLV